MKQEEKDLLLKDLCARLPYGVKFQSENVETVLFIDTSDNEVWVNGTSIDDFKPYLFPLSSMTEKQKEEYHYIVNYISPDDTENWAENEFVYVNQIKQLLHFYHINHLDWRGLIPKGLAIDATGLNIY